MHRSYDMFCKNNRMHIPNIYKAYSSPLSFHPHFAAASFKKFVMSSTGNPYSILMRMAVVNNSNTKPLKKICLKGQIFHEH